MPVRQDRQSFPRSPLAALLRRVEDLLSRAMPAESTGAPAGNVLEARLVRHGHWYVPRQGLGLRELVGALAAPVLRRSSWRGW